MSFWVQIPISNMNTIIDEDSVHKMHRIYMAYDYFRADSESAMDFHNKYPDYADKKQ